jgi:hypothetical protein
LHSVTDYPPPKTETAVSEKDFMPPVQRYAAVELALKAAKSRALREAFAAATTSTTASNASPLPDAPTGLKNLVQQTNVPFIKTETEESAGQGQKLSRGDDHPDKGHADGDCDAQRVRTNSWVANNTTVPQFLTQMQRQNWQNPQQWQKTPQFTSHQTPNFTPEEMANFFAQQMANTVPQQGLYHQQQGLSNRQQGQYNHQGYNGNQQQGYDWGRGSGQGQREGYGSANGGQGNGRQNFNKNNGRHNNYHNSEQQQARGASGAANTGGVGMSIKGARPEKSPLFVSLSTRS